jgi:hypothetical protein
VFFVSGEQATMSGTVIKPNLRFKMRPSTELSVVNGPEPSEFWVLECRPIGERQTAFGPVILEDTETVRNAMNEIRIKEFPEWPWGLMDVTNPIDMGRELHRADGSVEKP